MSLGKVRLKSEGKINRNRIMPHDSDGKATKSERRRCFHEIHQVLYLAYQPFLFNGSNTNMSNLANVSIIMIQIPITTTPAETVVILLGYGINQPTSIPGQPNTVSTNIHCVNTKVNTRVSCGINNGKVLRKT